MSTSMMILPSRATAVSSSQAQRKDRRRSGHWLATLLMLATASTVYGQRIEAELNFEQSGWFDSGTLLFAEAFLPPQGEPGNFWGNEEAAFPTDIYAETGEETGSADFVFPDQLENQDAIVANFDLRYLQASSAHSYVSIGNDDNTENAIWFGMGGGSFYVGTNNDFQLGTSAIPGGAIDIAFSTDASLPNDTRIGLRLAYDVASSTVTNLQIDSNNDGVFNEELLSEPINLSGEGLSPFDWLEVTFTGRGSARVDDIELRQLSLSADYNGDVDINSDDLDVLCSAIGDGTSDLRFDFNADGMVNSTDGTDFAFDNGGLTVTPISTERSNSLTSWPCPPTLAATARGLAAILTAMASSSSPTFCYFQRSFCRPSDRRRVPWPPCPSRAVGG